MKVMLIATALAAWAVPAAPPYGIYGGRQAQLELSEAGGVLETDCASGHIEGPLHFDSAGRFSARGSFDTHQPGPQDADQAAGSVPARFSGALDGKQLTLTIHHGGAQPLTLTLVQGRRAKIVRCL